MKGILIFVFLISIVEMKFSHENVVLAINCGGFGYQSPLGFKFLSVINLLLLLLLLLLLPFIIIIILF